MNPDGSINALANAWAAKTGRSRRWARGCLALLARSGAIVLEPMGSGYAWGLRRTTARSRSRPNDRAQVDAPTAPGEFDFQRSFHVERSGARRCPEA